LENFQRQKTWCQNTTFITQFTTNSPAIYHAFSPQIPATPLKNARKTHNFRRTPRQKKY
jgi:hypothetical protein